MYLKIAFILILICCLFSPIKADHAMGLDIQFFCIDPITRTYKIRAIGLFDCAGSGSQATINMNIIPENSDTLCPNILIELVPIDTTFNVLPFCNSLPQSCANPASPAIDQVIYEAIIVMPACRNNYDIFTYMCCRSSNFTNIFDPEYTLLTYKSSIYHQESHCNNTPQFNSLAFAKFCGGKPANYHINAFDLDGDSLTFELILPHTANSYPLVQYRNGLTFNNPIGIQANTIFDLNRFTGEIKFEPLGGIIQNTLIAIQINEYRNGILIGTYSRELIFTILTGCDNNQPYLKDISINGNSAYSTDISLCENENLSLNLTFEDLDSLENLTYTSNIFDIFPNAIVNTFGNNPLEISIYIEHNDINNIAQSIYWKVQNNACPVNAYITKVFKIRKNTIEANPIPPQTLCEAQNIPIYIDSISNSNYQYHWANQHINLDCINCNYNYAYIDSSTVLTGIIEYANCQKEINITINLEPINLILSGNTVNNDLKFNWNNIAHIAHYNGIFNQSDFFTTLDTFRTITNLNNDTCITLILNAENIYGCKDSDTLTLCSPACFRPIQSNLSAFICNIGQDAISLPMPFDTYLWSNNDTTASIYPNGSIEQYAVTVSSSPNCTHIYQYTINYVQRPNIHIDIVPESYAQAEDGKIIINAISPFSNIYTYNFQNQGFSDISEFYNLSSGNYELILIDENLCSFVYNIYLPQLEQKKVLFPDAFSPNNDGENDSFGPLNIEANNIKSFQIFNRWGECLHNDKSNWNGFYKGEKQSKDVYIYTLEYEQAQQQSLQIIKGSFLLIE